MKCPADGELLPERKTFVSAVRFPHPAGRIKRLIITASLCSSAHFKEFVMIRFIKRFFSLFKTSLCEVTGKNRTVCIVVSGLLIAVSMAIETFTIEIPFGKINFAFLAIAAEGMIFGPAMAFFAGGICDILGYIVHPDGAFIPTYILIAMLQGLIYGLVLYRRWGNMSGEPVSKGKKAAEFTIRVVTARILDVVIINLFLNTAANIHYGFIPEQALGTAVVARFSKNMIQLVADIPLMLAILPALLAVYNEIAKKSGTRETI